MLCTYGMEAKTTTQCILHCLHYENEHRILLVSNCEIECNILDNNELFKLIYGNDSLK